MSSNIVGKFIKFEENGNDSLSPRTYLVIGMFKIIKTNLLENLPVEFDCLNFAYVLLDANDDSFSVSYIYYLSSDSGTGITRFDTCIVDISAGNGINCNAIVIDSDLSVDEILRSTNKESRLNFVRSAIKYTQGQYARMIYDYKDVSYSKLPSYIGDMKRTLDPYFNPNKYIVKVI